MRWLVSVTNPSLKRGKREFVQILRRLEVLRPEDVLAGVRPNFARF
jgi:hypothetical protein